MKRFLLVLLMTSVVACTQDKKNEGGDNSPGPDIPQNPPMTVSWTDDLSFGDQKVTLSWFSSHQTNSYYLYRLKSDAPDYVGPILDPENENNYEALVVISSPTTSIETDLDAGKKGRYKIRARNEKGFSPWSLTKEVIGSRIYSPPELTHAFINDRVHIRWNTDPEVSGDPLGVEILRTLNNTVEETFYIDFADGDFIDFPSPGLEYVYKIKTISRAGNSEELSLVAPVNISICSFEDRGLGLSGLNQYSNESIVYFKTLYSNGAYKRFSLEKYDSELRFYETELILNNWQPISSSTVDFLHFDVADVNNKIFRVYNDGGSFLLEEKNAQWESVSSWAGFAGNFKLIPRSSNLVLAYDELSFEGLSTEVIEYTVTSNSWLNLNLHGQGFLSQLLTDSNKIVVQNQTKLNTFENSWSILPWNEESWAFDALSNIKTTTNGILYFDGLSSHLWPLDGTLRILGAKKTEGVPSIALEIDGVLHLAQKRGSSWVMLSEELIGLKKTESEIISLEFVDGPRPWIDFIEQRIEGVDVGVQVSCELL